MQGLGEDAESEETHHEQGAGADRLRLGAATRRPCHNTNATAPSNMKNQIVSWCGGAGAGNGHEIWASAPAFCKKPSKWPHDGGMGRLRPPRSLKTGSITIPCIAWPGPAVASCTT